MRIAIIGAGNMGRAIALGLSKGNICKPSDIICTARTPKTLEHLHALYPQFPTTLDNKEAIKGADIVLVAVKPWRLEAAINQIKDSMDYSHQIFVSIAAGVGTDKLATFLKKEDGSLPPIFYMIPNTAFEVCSSMTFLTSSNATQAQIDLMMTVMGEGGYIKFVEERFMASGTALASCGIAYVFRYIRATIEGGVEMGFYPEEAQDIVLHTVRGAVDLLLENRSNPEQEIDKVTTPGGITIKGLNEMERAGFTPSGIRGLKAGL